MAEPNELSYITCGSLRAITDPVDWSADRPVWIDTGHGLARPVYAGHIEADAPGALVLRSHLPWTTDPEFAPPRLWLVEWAGPIGADLPATTLHGSEIGARARLRAAARELGVEPGAGTRSPGGLWETVPVAGLVAMLRELPPVTD